MTLNSRQWSALKKGHAIGAASTRGGWRRGAKSVLFGAALVSVGAGGLFVIQNYQMELPRERVEMTADPVRTVADRGDVSGPFKPHLLATRRTAFGQEATIRLFDLEPTPPGETPALWNRIKGATDE